MRQGSVNYLVCLEIYDIYMHAYFPKPPFQLDFCYPDDVGRCEDGLQWCDLVLLYKLCEHHYYSVRCCITCRRADVQTL